MARASGLVAEATLVLEWWEQRIRVSEMTQGTAARYGRVFGSFVRFVGAYGLCSLSDVGPTMCRSFVLAPRSSGEPPAAATSRFRLTVVRDAYRALGNAMLVPVDPTVGIQVLQGPQKRSLLPLTPTEVSRLRSAGRLAPRDHLRPAAVELALAGASHSEIARVTVSDVDLRSERVRLGDRWRDLDAYACSTLSGRLASCRRTARRTRSPWSPSEVAVALPRPFKAYPATSIAPGVSSSLARAMKAAGLTRPGLRPASIREYTANLVYASTGRAEDVAEALGLGSLDRAMGFVDPTWQLTHGAEVRG